MWGAMPSLRLPWARALTSYVPATEAPIMFEMCPLDQRFHRCSSEAAESNWRWPALAYANRSASSEEGASVVDVVVVGAVVVDVVPRSARTPSIHAFNAGLAEDVVHARPQCRSPSR